MPRYSLELPDGGSIEYGLDLAIEAEWFADVLDEAGRTIESFDSERAAYDHDRPVRALLLYLGTVADLWDADDMADTTTRLISTTAEDLPKRLLVLGEVIENLRRAADQGRDG